jgi:hypothetical protein
LKKKLIQNSLSIYFHSCYYTFHRWLSIHSKVSYSCSFTIILHRIKRNSTGTIWFLLICNKVERSIWQVSQIIFL